MGENKMARSVKFRNIDHGDVKESIIELAEDGRIDWPELDTEYHIRTCVGCEDDLYERTPKGRVSMVDTSGKDRGVPVFVYDDTLKQDYVPAPEGHETLCQGCHSDLLTRHSDRIVGRHPASHIDEIQMLTLYGVLTSAPLCTGHIPGHPLLPSIESLVSDDHELLYDPDADDVAHADDSRAEEMVSVGQILREERLNIQHPRYETVDALAGGGDDRLLSNGIPYLRKNNRVWVPESHRDTVVELVVDLYL